MSISLATRLDDQVTRYPKSVSALAWTTTTRRPLFQVAAAPLADPPVNVTGVQIVKNGTVIEAVITFDQDFDEGSLARFVFWLQPQSGTREYATGSYELTKRQIVFTGFSQVLYNAYVGA